MNEYAKKIIHKEAERIKAKITDGKLYGEPLDLSDQDVLIVAAHYCGCLESLHMTGFPDMHINYQVE